MEQENQAINQEDLKKISEMFSHMNRKQRRAYCKINKVDYNTIFQKISKKENEKRWRE